MGLISALLVFLQEQEKQKRKGREEKGREGKRREGKRPSVVEASWNLCR